ncbi:metalloprotease PmbA [Lysobacter sp. ISL-50]|uniref:metalloprotease PmbA n=1 Tax=unclassified Lysobacter TaxID=2635362 RepID=UPI001BE980D2|nr:metalloprotease PmbA [Lysobacter sp. ISL-42]MBT2752891.1 metalloprotease PmbA [Lysobacter sp. ISL-50]MBT2775960.1 metalloprotease PmbA [Lysobacter sp. ISL-54]MBT2783777.1 metalloprotease PmbA [Lysobacter sp. ISL-52]
MFADPEARLDALSDLSQRLLAAARARGATQAEVSCSEETGLNVNVRMGEVETVEATRDRGIAVTVYFGQRKGSASTADLRDSSLEATVEQACAIARYTEDDSAAGLADAALMATDLREFDTWHPWHIDADRAIELALACEAAGREFDARIENSDGASVGTGASLGVYANSHGFIGRDRGTQHSLGCALIAGRGDSMQRDGWYTSALIADELESAASVGRKSAERTVARLAPRQLNTGEYPVLFAAESARSLIGHLLGAVSGGALYRRASFLVDSVGTQLFPSWFRIEEQPFLHRGLRSTSYDAEGVATRESALIDAGVLQRYVLGSYSARKLGLQSTANAGGVHNLQVAANAGDFESMLRQMGRGLLVTELMGQGVNSVTGDYSRGAAGFWVDNGEIQYPVDGITIAGNLRKMFEAIEAVGTDVDLRSHVRTGSILVGRMTVAGDSADD